jgi:hypothetical protein
MAILKRQKYEANSRSITTRIPEEIYEKMEELALAKRFSMAAIVTLLITKALAAEEGGEYAPYQDNEIPLARPERKKTEFVF